MSFSKLIEWSRAEFSHLPWRKNRSLYTTLVSEIMLQQTTVGTVKNHFERFIKRFSDLKSLASASEDELLIAWKGLGYYRRAKNLKKIAQYVLDRYSGEFPNKIEELQKIPGIGPYTSHALIAIGKNERALAVDANLERVIARLYGLKTQKGLKLQKEIREKFYARELFGSDKIAYRDLNEALMDLGRTYCQARKTSCELCPLRSRCQAFQEGKSLLYPKNKTINKIKVDHELHLLRLVVIKGNKVLVYKKSEGDWLAGQYELPTLVIFSTDLTLKQYPYFSGKIQHERLKKYKTGITKFKITNLIFETSFKSVKEFGFHLKLEWRKMDSEDSNLSTASTKALRLVRKKENHSK